MFKPKTISVILKILIQNRELGVNFTYKTHRKNLISNGHNLIKSFVFYTLPSQRLIGPMYKVA
jgi:hypothetical protein